MNPNVRQCMLDAAESILQNLENGNRDDARLTFKHTLDGRKAIVAHYMTIKLLHGEERIYNVTLRSLTSFLESVTE